MGTVKRELKFFNFGLPHDWQLIDYTIDKTTLDDVAKKYKALKELLVRLNVYMATGNHQEGTIAFPEANRIVHYCFSGRNIHECYVRFTNIVIQRISRVN